MPCTQGNIEIEERNFQQHFTNLVKILNLVRPSETKKDQSLLTLYPVESL